MPYKKPKVPFDASLQFDTYISFSENNCCVHMSYSLMLLFNGYVGYADCIKEAVFNCIFAQIVHLSDLQYLACCYTINSNIHDFYLFVVLDCIDS